MNAITHTVRIKDALFFAALTLISLVLHAVLLFGFRLTFRPLEEKSMERQFIKVGFVKKPGPAPYKAKPVLVEGEREKPAPVPAREVEIEEPQEVPEEFARFLEALNENPQKPEVEFYGDTYAVFEDDFPIARPDPETSRDDPEVQKNFLDPRVQMVVTRVPRDVGKNPPTYFEPRYSHVPYPDIQVEKKDYQKGWVSVYFVVDVDANGEVEQIRRVRPQNPDELQMVFVNAVLDSINSWTFDKEKSFLHVDVRFYLE